MRNYFLLLLVSVLCSCAWVKHRPNYLVTARVAAESTFKITGYRSDGEPIGYGTAWIAGIRDGETYFVTAGHVCNMDPTELAPTFKVMSKDDHYYDVNVKMSSEDPDLCLLSAKGEIGRPMLISWLDPEYATPVGYVGAPLGIFGGGLAPYYRGNFLGSHYISAPTAPGASGSAVWTSEGVVGVLVSVQRSFNTMVGIVPRQDLVNFLALAGFDYGKTTLPTLPH